MAQSAPYTVIAAAADIYIGNANETMPNVETTLNRRNLPDAASGTAGATSTGSWYYLGYTEGGVRVRGGQTTKDITVDQVTPPVKSMRTAQELVIATNIAELTMEAFKAAYNNTSITTSGKARVIDLTLPASIAQIALLVRFYSTEGGANDGSWLGQYEFPYVSQNGNPEVGLVKGEKAVLAVEFKAMLVAASIGSLKMRNTA